MDGVLHQQEYHVLMIQTVHLLHVELRYLLIIIDLNNLWKMNYVMNEIIMIASPICHL